MPSDHFTTFDEAAASTDAACTCSVRATVGTGECTPDAVDGAPAEDTTRGALTRRIARTCERGLGINELSAVERFAALLLVHRTIPLALTALLAEELTP